MLTIKAKTLSQLLNMVSEVNNEVKINLTENGLNIKLKDSSNVVIGVFSINESAFETYTAGESFDVYAYKILNIIRFVDPEELCTLKTEDDITSLEIGNKWFNVTVKDDLQGEPRIPDIELPFSFYINPKILYDDLRPCLELNDEISFGYYGNNVTIFSMEGNDLMYEAVYPQEKIIEKTYSSRFSLCWLIGLLSKLKYYDKFGCDEVKISFGNDYPLMIEGKVTDDLSFMFMLAPRIEMI